MVPKELLTGFRVYLWGRDVSECGAALRAGYEALACGLTATRGPEKAGRSGKAAPTPSVSVSECTIGPAKGEEA